MFFFGTGRRRKSKQLSPDKVVLNSYRYFYIMFLFTIVWGYRYSLATNTKDGWHYKDLTKEEAMQLTAGDPIHLNLWVQFSLLLLVVVVVIFFDHQSFVDKTRLALLHYEC